MASFRDMQVDVDTEELAVLQAAFEDACRELGIQGAESEDGNVDEEKSALAMALLACARRGERDPHALKLQALLAVRDARAGV
jgi:hypothetical protein